MARDMVALMEALGFPRFSLAGHDRGGRVAYRLTLDHPSRLERLALLDILPGTTLWQLADERFALGYWPWTLLAQDAPLPERLISGAPDALVAAALSGWGSPPGAFDAAARAAYVTMLSDSEHVHAICEEYRAAATLDRAHDDEDARARRRIACPALALWQPWCERLEGRAVEGGHFFPEANPRETAALLERFFSSRD
jgi:haloacetate dehalogenase